MRFVEMLVTFTPRHSLQHMIQRMHHRGFAQRLLLIAVQLPLRAVRLAIERMRVHVLIRPQLSQRGGYERGRSTRLERGQKLGRDLYGASVLSSTRTRARA